MLGSLSTGQPWVNAGLHSLVETYPLNMQENNKKPPSCCSWELGSLTGNWAITHGFYCFSMKTRVMGKHPEEPSL